MAAPKKPVPKKATPNKAASKAVPNRGASKAVPNKAGPNKGASKAAPKAGQKAAPKGSAVNTNAGTEDANSASKRLFDLRWLIAVMFVVYGIVLSITGIFDSQAEIHKAAGVRINLWTGIGMFVVGLFFAAWAHWRPLRPE